jgi:hypothetical protein
LFFSFQHIILSQGTHQYYVLEAVLEPAEVIHCTVGFGTRSVEAERLIISADLFSAFMKLLAITSLRLFWMDHPENWLYLVWACRQDINTWTHD